MSQAGINARYGFRGGAQQPFDRNSLGGRSGPVGPPCARCGKAMLGGQQHAGRDRHFMCDAGAVEGKVCTCPPGCSDKAVGDGKRDCDPECVPCRQHRGQSLVKAPSKAKARR